MFLESIIVNADNAAQTDLPRCQDLEDFEGYVVCSNVMYVRREIENKPKIVSSGLDCYMIVI